jgi:hypothetical protein
MQTLTRLTVATQASLEATAKEAHSTTMAELESVRELRRTVEAVKGQAEVVQVMSVAEREHAVQRMLERTLPLFAERLQKVLAIREARWNADQARKRYAVAGLVFLGVFLSGVGLGVWAQRDPAAAMITERCLSSVVQAAGHTYCRLDDVQPVPRTP